MPQPFGPAAEWEESVAAPPAAPSSAAHDAARAFRALHPAAADDSWGCSRAADPAARLLDDFRLSDPEPAEEPRAPKLPEVGDDFLGFHLLAELGRGAFGRVYLAQQGDLADRFVALKVSTGAAAESQKLARLQHTHIVPVYSCHKAGALQAVCMPYFGATTLGDVLADLGRRGSLPASGKGFVTTLHDRRSRAAAATTPATVPGPGAPVSPVPNKESSGVRAAAGPRPAPDALPLHTLEGLSYVGAVLWIGARLADGLAHAHARGLLHRDLKPANVLLTDDGQPMLLDFNLAEDAGSAEAASVGGTLPYMAPEQLAAFHGLRHAVDERSDVYSLGVILYELTTGRHPFSRHAGAAETVLPRMLDERLRSAPAVRKYNPAASPAVEAILRRCLAPDPVDRYPTARQLQEDLERQLAHRPLAHTREPSLRERAAKWLRRNPRAVTGGRVGTVAAVLVTLLIAVLWVYGERLARFEAVAERSRFRTDLAEARLLLGAREVDVDARDQGRAVARRALARYGALDDPGWRERPAVQRLPDEDRGQLPAEVGELLLLTAGADAAAPDRDSETLHAALGLNERAEACFGADQTPQALWRQRADLARLMGRDDDARRFRDRAEQTPVRDSWDSFLLAREQAAEGRYGEALAVLRQVRMDDPANFAALFLMGNCGLDASGGGAGREADAVSCYSACIALRPDFAGAWFNRGLAYTRQQAYEAAMADFTRAAQLRPTWAEPYVQRARIQTARGKLDDALDDLDRAFELGTPFTRVHFLRAKVRWQRGDASGANRDLEEVLTREPTDEESWICRGIARLSRDDTQGALADFAAAVKANPKSLPGLQNQAHVLSERLHRPADALSLLDRVLAMQPDFAPALAGRAVLNARLGRRDAARADARRVEELAPNDGASLFRAACAFALAAQGPDEDYKEAFHLLMRSLRSGYGWEGLRDDDLDALKADPRFQTFLKAGQELSAAGP
jgi:serine/threonine protein kinase/regulator of sirC expression with transglutaminase-like and TPR domain